MKEEACVIAENRNIGKNYFLMKLRSDYISGRARPGNFIMLAASGTFEPLLKRPFGILRVRAPFFCIYYEVVGKGTELISRLKPGDTVNVVGPLGNSFPALAEKNILTVAGGRGIAPIYYAIEDYTGTALANNVFLIYGARSKEELNLLEDIETLSLKKLFLYTDDGSAGTKGLVTQDIREIIRDHDIDVTVSCGPDAMFENLFHVLKDMGTENYFSMEALMGCGFGICHSCVVKTVADDYKKVCTDGPVFKMEEIVWGA
jgi:dihydroorotate dehydrogenase electron transfer subunit